MKRFLALALLCSSFACVYAADGKAGVDGDVEDWGVVENGLLSVKVSIANANAASLTLDGEETPVSLADGVNTVRVPDSNRVIIVKSKDGFFLKAVTVGGKTVPVVEGTATVTCEPGKEVVITTAPDTSSAVSAIEMETVGKPRYFDLTGMEVKVPAKGNIYIMLKDGKAVKVRM